MIQHTVAFKLKHSDPERVRNFFNAARKLSSIPGVEDFECLKQTGIKNKFSYGLSMKFASRELYEGYNSHPNHLTFVLQYWLTEVEDFLEIDYEPLILD